MITKKGIPVISIPSLPNGIPLNYIIIMNSRLRRMRKIFHLLKWVCYLVSGYVRK